MPETSLGFLIRYLREQRSLSLRELGRLADIDHAYVHRLETGDKESPSEDVLSKLITALKPGKREAQMLHYLASHSEIRSELVDLVVKDPTINFDIFTGAAGMASRGKRPDYPTIIARIRAWKAEDGNG